jgi:MFS family permease
LNRNLALLLSGQLISQIGDKFYMLAVAFLVLKTTGSPAQMGLVLFCSVFPGMLLGFISGAFLDRYNRKAIIVWADITRGLVVAGVCFLFYMNALTFPLLLAAQVVISICTAFFDPAIPTILPQIVEPDRLPRANSQTQFVSGISKIFGPLLGGLTVAWAGYLPVFVINAGSYLVSAGFECFIRLPVTEKAASVQKTRIVEDIFDGCRYIYRRRTLMIILLMVGLIHFFVGSIEAVIPVLATDLKGGGAENIGFIQTCFGIGTVLAALFISIRNLKRDEAFVLFSSVFLIGIALLMIGALYMVGFRLVVPYLMVFMIFGVLIIFAGTSFRSMIQKEVDNRIMGRVFGFVSTVGNTSIPLAMLVFGLLLENISHSTLLVVSGLMLLPTSILCYTRYMATRQRAHPSKDLALSKTVRS